MYWRRARESGNHIRYLFSFSILCPARSVCLYVRVHTFFEGACGTKFDNSPRAVVYINVDSILMGFALVMLAFNIMLDYLLYIRALYDE